MNKLNSNRNNSESIESPIADSKEFRISITNNLYINIFKLEQDAFKNKARQLAG